MFFLLIPVFTALAVLVVVGPALVPGIVLLALGWLGYHLIVRHHQRDESIRTH